MVPMFLEGSATVSALSTAATSIVAEITNIVTTVGPIALGVLTVTIGLYFGVKFIRKIIK